eukprot:GHVU01037494.1.p1 GENE.GHVU01037494.1~~GHVU01037494.1.p1  ORF type:complete len:229 (-),score=6.22 GHVU01037494.1:160-846(-)
MDRQRECRAAPASAAGEEFHNRCLAGGDSEPDIPDSHFQRHGFTRGEGNCSTCPRPACIRVDGFLPLCYRCTKHASKDPPARGHDEATRLMNTLILPETWSRRTAQELHLTDRSSSDSEHHLSSDSDDSDYSPHTTGLAPVQRTRRASRLGGQQSHRHACVCGGRRPDQPGRRSVAVQTVRVMPPGEKVPAQRPTLCFTAGQLDRSCVPTPPVDSSCYTPECSDDGTE